MPTVCLHVPSPALPCFPSVTLDLARSSLSSSLLVTSCILNISSIGIDSAVSRDPVFCSHEYFSAQSVRGFVRLKCSVSFRPTCPTICLPKVFGDMSAHHVRVCCALHPGRVRCSHARTQQAEAQKGSAYVQFNVELNPWSRRYLSFYFCGRSSM